MTYFHAGTALNDKETTVADAILAALPALTGSEKQIAYALDMRIQMAVYATLTTFGASIRKHPDTAELAAQIAGRVKQSDRLMVADAHRWIEAGNNDKGRPDLGDIANGKAPL